MCRRGQFQMQPTTTPAFPSTCSAHKPKNYQKYCHSENFLHDSRFPLAECDVSLAFLFNVFNFDLSTAVREFVVLTTG